MPMPVHRTYMPCLVCFCTAIASAAPQTGERPYVGAAPRNWQSNARRTGDAYPAPSEAGKVAASATSLSLLPDPEESLKNRFISFSNPAAGPTALRVSIVVMHQVDPPYTRGETITFTQFEGQSLFVGPPIRFVESRASGAPFHAARLQCEPYYHDWSTIGLVNVTGEAIVPSSTYDVEILGESCVDNEANCADVSVPLAIATSRWGDIVHSDSEELTDFADIGALVDKFKDFPGAPAKPQALLVGENERGWLDLRPEIGYTHVSVAVDAFRGLPYPHKPGKCSNNSMRACISDDQCSGEAGGLDGVCLLCGMVDGGACCHGDGTCDIVPQSLCAGPTDTYMGDGEPCSRCCGPSPGCKALTNVEWLEVHTLWPHMDRRDVCKESEGLAAYNCVAWAIDNTSEWVWEEVDVDGDGVWELSDFETFFALYQKSVIIYGGGNDGILHTARPLPNNCASSKAGEWIRIRHDRNEIEGGYYGDIRATNEY